MPAKVRIGAVAYLNTRPLVFGMQRGLGAERVALSYEVPAVLADRMFAGELDIALLPVIELARMPELELVPGLSIATRGPSRSVLLVSRCPVETVESVALDPESRTSNALLRVLFAELWNRRPRFRTGPRELAAALAECDAALRIGDKALFEALPDGCSSVDLGGLWTEATGLPFVFAAWAARPGIVDREVYRILHASRREGARAVERIAASYTWQGRRYPEIARTYLTEHILFRLGAPELDALRTFLAVCARLGLIERAPEVKLALGGGTACRDVAATHGALTLRGPGSRP